MIFNDGIFYIYLRRQQHLSYNQHYALSLGSRLDQLPPKIQATAKAEFEATLARLTPDDLFIVVNADP
jgi:hypothetical protein